RVKRLSIGVTGILGVIVFLMAFDPPELIIWLNLFAFGGLEAAFIWPIVLGLYWRKGNRYGALTSMITGASSYVLFEKCYPEACGMHSVVRSSVLSFVVYVVVRLSTQRLRGNIAKSGGG